MAIAGGCIGKALQHIAKIDSKLHSNAQFCVQCFSQCELLFLQHIAGHNNMLKVAR